MKVLKHLYYAIIVAYFPCVLILPLLIRESGGIIASTYGFELLMIFLYTLPLYFAFIEIGMTIRRIFDKEDGSKLEKLLNILSVGAAVGIITAVFNYYALLYLAVSLAVMLVIIWIINAAVYKKRIIDTQLIKQKSFWISAVALLIVVITVTFACKNALNSKNKLDDTISVCSIIVIR